MLAINGIAASFSGPASPGYRPSATRKSVDKRGSRRLGRALSRKAPSALPPLFLKGNQAKLAWSHILLTNEHYWWFLRVDTCFWLLFDISCVEDYKSRKMAYRRSRCGYMEQKHHTSRLRPAEPSVFLDSPHLRIEVRRVHATSLEIRVSNW